MDIQKTCRSALAPTRIESRLRQMYYEPPLHAATQLYSVLTEILSMIEENYPQIDTVFTQYGLDQELPKAYDRPDRSPNEYRSGTLEHNVLDCFFIILAIISKMNYEGNRPRFVET
jgi:hypothetical protein